MSQQATDGTAKPPSMELVHNSRAGVPSVHGKEMGVFTGEVWLDRVIKQDNMSVVNVNFTPCARTNWHRHEGGQLLRVTAGSGWICDKGKEPRRIVVGDVIWCPPGSVHWHGADNGSYMVHEAVTLGKIDWYEKVQDDEYAAKE